MNVLFKVTQVKNQPTNQIISIAEDFIKESELLITNTNFINQIITFQINM